MDKSYFPKLTGEQRFIIWIHNPTEELKIKYQVAGDEEFKKTKFLYFIVNADKSSTVLLEEQTGIATLKNSLAIWIPSNRVNSIPGFYPTVYICETKGQKCLKQHYL